MKKQFIYILSCTAFILAGCNSGTNRDVQLPKSYAHSVDSVLNMMTLREKVGQLVQYTGNSQATGPVQIDSTINKQIINGDVGSMLNVSGAENTRKVQELAMKSRLHIPLIFGLDVIHGLSTIFPIPLADACSMDSSLIRRVAAGAAKEAAAEGIHWTFAPMVNVSRDARWGRVMEGAGEDTWYNSQVAKYRIKGFQGSDLKDLSTILACTKHYIGYGACIAGKDYNSVDMSLNKLYNVYLPPYISAIEANSATFMSSFNLINGVPATGNIPLLRDLLKNNLGYDGFVVSDWGSVREMISHGYVKDLKDATAESLLAGCDMDMESRGYHKYLEELVNEGKISEKLIDDAVRRILLKKFELGLFEDPYRYCDQKRQDEIVGSKEITNLAREAAVKSIVLLKNKEGVLPLKNNIKKLAVIGSLAKSKRDMFGSWIAEGDTSRVVTLYDGLKNRYPSANIKYSEGYRLSDFSLVNINKTLRDVRSYNTVIVAVGERYNEAGEARSKTDININENQQILIKALKKAGHKVIALVMCGRPVIFNEMEPYSDAIMVTWWLGTEAGNAMADAISGDKNEFGRLVMTFPRSVGQLPLYYNYDNTGRPTNEKERYTCRYIDEVSSPAYPFGYGLSYTTFTCSKPVMDKESYKLGEDLTFTVTVTNTGNREGKPFVQVYFRDKVASIARPIKEFSGWSQDKLKPGESKKLHFSISPREYGFYNDDFKFIVEAGEFDIMAGLDSEHLSKVTINVTK